MNWFKNLKIGYKMGAGFVFTILLLLVTAILGIWGTSRSHRDMEEFMRIHLPSLDYLIEADRDLQQLLVAERSMIFTDIKTEEFKGFEAAYEENMKQSHDRLQKYEALTQREEERTIFKQYLEERKIWEELSRKVVAQRKSDIEEGKRLAMELSLGKGEEAFTRMRNHLDKLQEIKLNLAESFRNNSNSVNRKMIIGAIAFSSIAILLLGIFMIMLNRTVTRSIKEMMARGQDLAQGKSDLTRRLNVKSKDEIGILAGLLDKFLERIEGIIVQVKDSTQVMLKSTQEIADGSQDLASRTNQQAASITETSSTLEEFASILKHNSDQSIQANAKIEKLDTDVKNKRELIRNVTQTMSEIDQSSKEIGKIMNVINDISFQTNLLALNAAVEAARAGEAGRGFAVVASEVRNLAQKTADSSKTIQEIVTTNVDSTQRGMELVKETESFFETVMGMLGELSAIIRNIDNGSREQATGMEQISQAVMQLEQVINQNAQLVSNFAETGKRMSVNSDQLRDLMDQFITASNLENSKINKAENKSIHHSIPSNKNKKSEQKQEKPKVTQSIPVKTDPSKLENPTVTEDFFASEEEGFEEF